MAKPRHKKGVVAHLLASGILDTGSPDAISKARQEYWRDYRRQWMRKKRLTQTAFAVNYSKTEVATITKAAKCQNISVTAYIKLASLTTHPISLKTIGTLRARLLEHYGILETMLDQSDIPSSVSALVLQEVSALETFIVSIVNKTMEVP